MSLHILRFTSNAQSDTLHLEQVKLVELIFFYFHFLKKS